MSIRRAIPVIGSEDLAASRAFWIDFLGFEPAMDQEGFLMARSPAEPTTQVIVGTDRAMDPQILGVDVSVEVGDADAAHAEAVRRGLEIVYPLTDEPWGIRRFFVRDPDGNVVNVAAHIDAPDGEPAPTVWPVLHYDDTNAALAFLTEAFGFRDALVAKDAEGSVIHAELRWPEGGAVVFGSTRHDDGVHGGVRAGSGAVYVSTDRIDETCERARQADAEIVESPHETEFGSGAATRAFTARDPEGNLWTFGTYRGAP